MPLIGGPPTLAVRQARQQNCYDLLGELLALARERGLPVIDWRVSDVAVVGALAAVANADRRRVFDAWVEALELDRWDDHPLGAGWVHLHAFAKNWRGRRVDVAVMADVDTEEEP